MIAWGVDVAVQKIAIATPDDQVVVGFIGKNRDGAYWSQVWDTIHKACSGLGSVDRIVVEAPAGRVHPNLQRMVGVLLGALHHATGAEVSLVYPKEWWKAIGLKIHPHEKRALVKPKIMAWAKEHGYVGECQDSADAFCIRLAA